MSRVPRVPQWTGHPREAVVREATSDSDEARFWTAYYWIGVTLLLNERDSEALALLAPLVATTTSEGAVQ